MTPEIRGRISTAVPKGADHPLWSGGEWESQGRFRVLVPRDERHLHPTCGEHGYMLRYHYVWNTHHPADPVQRGEVVHHIDHDSRNDDISNLEKMPDQSPHAAHHFRQPRRPLSDAHREAIAAAHRKEYEPRDCERCGKALTRPQLVQGNRFCGADCHYAFRKGKGRTGW